MAPATVEVSAWAAKDSSGHLAPFTFLRRATGPGDVKFKVLFCGICLTDLHQIHNDWGQSIYPMVPGHKIVGEVTEVGSEVKAFKVGEIVGVGCMYCQKKVIWTCSVEDYDGTVTQGGYFTIMVYKQEFVLKMPTNLPLDAAAPLLCADPQQMKTAAGTIDYIIDTVSASDPLDPHLMKPLSIHAFSLTSSKWYVGGSGIGGIKETQEMLDLCGEHNITHMIEKIPISYINTVIERLEKVDVKYHFVIDIGNSLKSEN
ncbi:hypothetical protein BDL97_07G012800 [Sphagnum fallax]|nr:hypothetical protein BDL97_07G012800 [Sphagnum fallax]